jgi:cation transport ATPase
MTAIASTSSKKSTGIPALATSAVLITLFLFYIDEGYYNFRWMADIGNWIVFVVYATVIFAGQWLVAKLVPSRFHGIGRTAVSVVIGTSVALLFLIYIVFGHVN